MSDQTRTENAIELGKMYMLLDAANAREAALREDLENTQKLAGLNAKLALALQQRLTVADQEREYAVALVDVNRHMGGELRRRVSELESAARGMLRVAGIANQGSNAYNRAIINLNAALKPVTEAESERGQGIPGTSFQRLNQLANEGE